MKILVIGLGYVGTANAVLLSQQNEVICYDFNSDRINLINDKKSPIQDREATEYLIKKNLNINKWIKENMILINSSLAISILTLLTFDNSYILVVTVAVSFMLILITVNNLFKNFRKSKINKTYWTGQIAHLGIAIFAFGIILNVSQSYSTEKEINSFEEFSFNDQTYFVYDSIEESFPEKNVIKLPISNQNTTKFTSLNIFNNSSQQAISSPAVFRTFINDVYITVKFIDENSYKLIVRNNYGIFIMWIGLFVSSISFVPRLSKNEK